MGDEWVVVGGKGKPRKSRGAAAAAATNAGAPPPAASTPPAQPLPPNSLPEPPPLLPGWEGGRSSSGPATSSGGAGRPSRRPRAARTPEERLENLAAAVADCAREVAASPMFAHLRAAMAAAEAGAAPDAADGGSSSQNGCQQQPLQPQQQQQPCPPRSEQPQPPPPWRWGGVRELVVYGLGCIEDSRTSRYQLALVLALSGLLPGLSSPPQLFDPAFSELDAALLARLGLRLIARDEGGARRVEGDTLFYLPHCEAALCENLLAANWDPSRLPRVAILGNSFASYWERWNGSASRPGGTRPERLLRLVEAGAVTELPVPDGSFHVASAFNDSSLHTFPPAACARVFGP
ncbi:hypothetical protein Rsub_09127 [Raphidocelis subcapitata]|uniref:SRR1-like domain-containing protein n=1 Tax=Raphidocelis subcapitata TaxID=307507 RepID=A0A2V0P9L3_9CHLO|nr:hypothetical protein Rsub_09127 [Raphidocelis subcapitata]|eukprot:GBF96544.1 hypothetical protein Rsub_09127 [Raphidocelis subcapitata]